MKTKRILSISTGLSLLILLFLGNLLGILTDKQKMPRNTIWMREMSVLIWLWTPDLMMLS